MAYGGSGVSPLIYRQRSPPPLAQQTHHPVSGQASHCELQAHFSCMAYGVSRISPLIYSERSLPLGPTDTSSSAWTGTRTAIYNPYSHAWLMGEVGSHPLYMVRGSPPPPTRPNRHVILCLGRPSHSNLHAHFSCMAYGASGVTPLWPNRHVIIKCL